MFFFFFLSGLFCCLGLSFFCFFCLGGGPAQTAKMKTRPRPNSKTNKHAPAASERVFVAVWVGGRGRVFFVFCCLGLGVFISLLFGRGACFFFAVWAGDESSLTYRSAWLVFKRPNNKKDQTAKTQTQVPTYTYWQDSCGECGGGCC